MAQERVSRWQRFLKWLREATSQYDVVDIRLTEETDGKDTFYYERAIGHCTRCGCGVEVEVSNRIMTEEEYKQLLPRAYRNVAPPTPPGKVIE